MFGGVGEMINVRVIYKGIVYNINLKSDLSLMQQLKDAFSIPSSVIIFPICKGYRITEDTVKSNDIEENSTIIIFESEPPPTIIKNITTFD